MVKFKNEWESSAMQYPMVDFGNLLDDVVTLAIIFVAKYLYRNFKKWNQDDKKFYIFLEFLQNIRHLCCR